MTSKAAVTNLFIVDNGWTHGVVDDTDPKLFEKELSSADNPVRAVNIQLTQLSKELGVSSTIVPIPVTCKYALATPCGKHADTSKMAKEQESSARNQVLFHRQFELPSSLELCTSSTKME
jgi:hypothetical protein